MPVKLFRLPRYAEEFVNSAGKCNVAKHVIKMYTTAAQIIAATMSGKARRICTLNSLAYCEIVSKPINAHGISATIVKTCRHGESPSAK